MKTAWFEDILSLVPAAAFLCAALALFCMGAFLLFDAVSALLAFEHPTIGTVVVLGQQVAEALHDKVLPSSRWTSSMTG